MNKSRQEGNWTKIEIPSGGNANIADFELNLEDDPDNTPEFKEEAEVTNNVEEGQGNRRQKLVVQEDQKNKNSKARSEDEEDKEERAVQERKTRVINEDVEEEDSENSKRNSRAHKRIQTLLAREREYQAELTKQQSEKVELRRQLAQSQRKQVETSRDSYKNQLDTTEVELAKAIGDNDAPRIAKLTKQIADTTMRYNAYQAVSDEPEQEIEEAPQRQQVGNAQGIEAAKAWVARNPKFQKDRTFHVNARLISDDLAKEGVLDPGDEDYWEELDKRLKKTLKSEDDQVETPQPTQGRNQPVRRGSPVGSRNDEDNEDLPHVDRQFKRSGGTVQANPTQDDYEIAEKFGLKIGDLMQEKYKYAKQGYKGYVEIDIPGQKSN